MGNVPSEANMGNDLKCINCGNVLRPCLSFSNLEQTHEKGRFVYKFNKGQYYRKVGHHMQYQCKDCFFNEIKVTEQKEKERQRRDEQRREEQRLAEQRQEEERQRQEKERQRQEKERQRREKERQRKKEEFSQRVKESRERAKRQYEKQQRSRQEYQSKHKVQIAHLKEFDTDYESYSGKDEFLKIMSLKCNSEASDFSLTSPKLDLVGKILSALENLLFNEWINYPPSASTLQHAQVYITELCALSVEIPEEVSRENISNNVQSLVESINHSACNIPESLELTRALYLTLMHYICENVRSDVDPVVIAKKWATEELTMEELFPVEFLSILISSMHSTVSKNSIFILKIEIQCLKLLISTLVNLHGKENHCASTQMILRLVEMDQWTPMEAVNLLKEVSLKCTQDVLVTKVLKLVEVYDVSPSWVDDSGCSLIQVLDSVGSKSFCQEFQKIIKKKDEKSLDSALGDIKVSQKLDDSRINEIKSIITGVFQSSESGPKGSLKYKMLGKKNLQTCLSQLCKAVFDTKGWWPSVKHMVQWCVLIQTGITKVPQLVSSEEDSCAIAMFAAAQFYFGNKTDIVLNSNSETVAQTKEWSDFYKSLGISVKTNIRKQTDSCFRAVFEADVIYGTLENFVSDYFLYWKETTETQIPSLTRGFIIDNKCLTASLSFNLQRLKDKDSLACAAEVLQNLVRKSHTKDIEERKRFIKSLFQALQLNIKEGTSTGAKFANFLKIISGKELLPKELFNLNFLENLLKAVPSGNEGEKSLTPTPQKLCLESLLSTSEQRHASNKRATEVLHMVSNLGDKNLWTPLELLKLLGVLTDLHKERGCNFIKEILHLLKIYQVSSKWKDEKSQSVISLIEARKTENVIEDLKKSLEKEKNIDTIFDEIRQINNADEEILKKSKKIVSYVTDLIKTREIKKHNNIKSARALSHSTETEDLQKVLAVLCNAVHLRIAKEKWWPRISQMISWSLLALSNTGKLLEVGTGEGKSCIIAMFAAFRALRGEKVDVVSSSSILSERDAKDMKDFFKYFDITVDTNTNKTGDSSRKQCYQQDIVYGTIESFAADHLRQIFEMKDIRSNRNYQCIIIDEVDSMLLDQGVQLTYLSSPMVSMEHLNTILAMIWAHVQQYGFLSSRYQTFVHGSPTSFFKAIFDSINTEETEINEPLDILYLAEVTGMVEQGFTQDIHKGGKEDILEINVILEKLKIVTPDAMVHFFEELEGYVPYGFTIYTLNDEGLLCLRKLSPYNTNQIPDLKFLVLDEGLCCPLYDSEEVLIKPIAEFISEKIQYTPCTNSQDKHDKSRQTQISIPGFLKDLINTKMSLWVENAFLAKQLREGRDYVVENENVCPVDFRSTGIIELNKKWGDGLQQFVEIKHQIKLSTISTVTNYISNISLFQKYHGKIYGTTGTLGSEKDISLLQKLYPSLSACRMPTFNRKKLYEVKGTLKKTYKEWKSEIKEVVKNVSQRDNKEKGRAILVICETINKAQDIYEELKSPEIPGKIIPYWRSDAESLRKIEEELVSGDVIVATNIAGRGTDIKVSDQVNRNGGLYVILSFLPENTRVELQAFGRTARKGKPGSAQIIMCTEYLHQDFKTALSLEDAKRVRDRLAVEKINSMMNDVSEMELREELFSVYCETLHDIYQKTDGDDRKVIVAIMNEFWGIWLQIKSEDIEQHKKSELLQSLRKDLLLARKRLSSKTSPCSSIYHYIDFGNILLDEKKWEGALSLFEKAMNQDESWAAIAFYNHAYCTIKLSKENYVTKAKEDLQKAQESLNNLKEECMICLQFTKMVSVDSDKSGTSNLEKGLTTKCSMYSLFEKNIIEAIEKLDEINEKSTADKSNIYSMVEGADEYLQEEAYNLYNRGLKYVFVVKEQRRFPWEGLLVFCLGVLQIIAGTLLTVCTAGTLAQIGIGLITEGISDCIDGITAMATGEFSWKEWATEKAISIGVSIISFGVGRLITKGFKAAKTFKALGKQMKSYPKLLYQHAKTELSTVTKANMKKALKATGKTIVEAGLSYGLEKGEEIILDEILKGIREEVKNGVVNEVKANLEREPLATLVDTVIFSNLHEGGKEEFHHLLQDDSSKEELLSIYEELGTSALQPVYADLSWQNEFNSKIIEVIGHAEDMTCGKKHRKMGAILEAFKTTHYSILAGQAISDVLTLSSKFFSNLKQELNKFNSETNTEKVKQNELTDFEIGMLKKFKQELADTLSTLLADALMEVFNHTFFSQIVSCAQSKVNDAIKHVRPALRSSKMEKKQRNKQKNNYIANNQDGNFASNTGHHSRSHAEKIKNNKTAGTLLDIRILSEATCTTVVILTENMLGELTKMQEVSPSNKSASETVTLIYRPKSTQNPNGHYDAFINNKKVSINGKQKSSLFHALARGMKPHATEEEISSEANRLRLVEAETLVEQPGQWESFVNRKEWTEIIRGGDWYMTDAGRPERIIKENKTLLQKVTGNTEQYKEYFQNVSVIAVKNNVNVDQQPPNSSLVEAEELNHNSKLALAMLQVRKHLPVSDTSKASDEEKHKCLKLPTDYNLTDIIDGISSPEPKALRTCLATMISKEDVVGTFKLMMFVGRVRCQLSNTKTVQNKQSKTRIAMFEKSFQENSGQMVQKWYNLLHSKGIMTKEHLMTIMTWINNQGYKDLNDKYRKQVSNALS